MPRPSKPDLTPEELASCLERRERLGGKKGGGYRALAHEISKQRGAFSVADPRVARRRAVSHQWLRDQMNRQTTPTVKQPVGATLDEAPTTDHVDIAQRGTDCQVNMFTVREESS